MPLVMRFSRFSLLLFAMLVFSIRWGHLVASPLEGTCENTCDSSSACDEECLVGLDTDSTCGDYGTCYAYECGDVCGSSVDCATPCFDTGDTTCGDDEAACYGTCGDGVCQSPYEACGYCEADCGLCPPDCNEGDPSCSVTADCPYADEGQLCDNRCCINPCSGNCDGRTRSCDDENEVCDNSGQCCSDEKCVQVGPGGPSLCFQMYF